MLKEVIVVEGKDDVAAVKRACQAEVIITNGLGLTDVTLELIAQAQSRCGVIILTDPDYPGEKIRRMIDQVVPGCRHAFVHRERAQGDRAKIGVEYASPQEIRRALSEARASEITKSITFGQHDLVTAGLLGSNTAGERRKALGQALGLGVCNGKQLLNRLNAFGITREEFDEAVQALGE